MKKPPRDKQRDRQRGRFVLKSLPFGLLFVLGVAIVAISVWYMACFNMEFKELLFTMLSPLKGTGRSTVAQILQIVLPAVLAGLIGYAALIWLLVARLQNSRTLRRIGAGICAGSFLFSLVFAVFALRLPGYLVTLNQQTTLYEDYYVDPDTVEITANGKTKNLICIYLESMETTYASEISGGEQPFNYMPHLTALARENLSFSDSELLGGFHSPSGTSWTMGALMGTTSGVPFSLQVLGGDNSHNSMSRYEEFAPGLTALGDILAEHGYAQEFLCGSDASFAGRDTYFRQHGNYEIFDLFTARERGYIPEDYFEWWGFEDAILFEIAKDELTALAAADQPFNFTMLTVDAHHVGGYVCERCQDLYSPALANVISCTDSLVDEFLSWCREQEFYKDSVIVIVGDHPRMDTTLVEGLDYYERTMYNCIINADVEVKGSTQNRVFTTFDLFPTTLAAMGFSIEGERLGLGTNLFSELPTLAEEKGYEWFNRELDKYSSYYAKHFT